MTFELCAHLVFVPKYRRGVITQRVYDILRGGAWQKVCEEANFEDGHVHLLVNYPPKVSLSKLVNSLKGVSARRARQANLPEVRKALWGQHFWSPSYLAVSCGEAPLETTKRYVQSQRGDSAPALLWCRR